MTHAERIARNIRRNHGQVAFVFVLSSLRDQSASYSEIGRALGVSKQRVAQWAWAMGSQRAAYILHPDVAGIAYEADVQAVP